jgi:hypothetical protein
VFWRDWAAEFVVVGGRCTMPIPDGRVPVRWLWGGALIRQSAKIVQSIGDFNLLCSFGGSNFKSLVCFGATATAVVIFR